MPLLDRDEVLSMVDQIPFNNLDTMPHEMKLWLKKSIEIDAMRTVEALTMAISAATQLEIREALENIDPVDNAVQESEKE